MNCQINKNLLPIKLFYLFFYGAVSSVAPFLPHFLQQKGFSSGDVSIIGGTVPFVIILAKPLIGHFADKTNRHRLAIFCCLLTGCLFFCLTNFVDSLSDETALNASSTGNASAVTYFNFSNYSTTYDRLATRPAVSTITHFHTYQFWIMLIFIVIANGTGLSPSYTIMDTITMNILKNRPQDFGKQRMWMAVGLASTIFCVSAIMDATSAGQPTVSYLPGFISFIFCIFCTCVCVYFVKSPFENVRVAKTRESTGLGKILPVLMKWKILLFLFMTLVLGINFGKTMWMTVWYLKELGAPQLTVAICISFTSMASMVFSFFSGTIIKRIGHELSLVVCMFSFGVRAWLWSMVSNPWHSVPIELLSGLSLGLWFATMVSYANKISPKGSEATSQSVLSGVYDGLGTGIGNLSSGWVYLNYGGLITWRVYGTFTCALAFLYFVIIILFDRPKFRQIKEQSNYHPEEKPLKKGVIDGEFS